MTIDLFLFTTDAALARRAVRGGAAGVVIDWERADKVRRQLGADTQINSDTPEDLWRVRGAVDGRVLCRINPFGPTTRDEIATALALGADELLVPMVRRPDEVEHVLDAVNDRAGVGMLIETADAAREPAQFAGLPLSRVYVGLNDLAIERGSRNIFRAVVDGTVANIAAEVTRPFGFAGLTDPERGTPIPCRLLLGALVQFGASFTFLRRSFLRDLGGDDPEPLIARILDACSEMASKPGDTLAAALDELTAAVGAIERPALSGSAQ
jgi:hypothetical protein